MESEGFLVHFKFKVSQVCHNWTARLTSHRETAEGLRLLNLENNEKKSSVKEGLHLFHVAPKTKKTKKEG